MNQQYLKSLLLDLLQYKEVSSNGCHYKIWHSPVMKENIEWFTQKGNEKNLSFKAASHNDVLLTERLEFFIKEGIDLKDSVIDIIRVNCPLMLQKALENGADPNLPNKDGQLPIDLAITQGKTKLSKLLVNTPNFNFISHNNNYPNIFLWAMSYFKIDLAHEIAKKRPNFILDKLGDLSFAYLGAIMIERDRGKSEQSDLLNLLDFGIGYAYSKGHIFDINETHKGETLIEHSIEVANIIKKFEIDDLNRSLEHKDSQTIKKIKL